MEREVFDRLYIRAAKLFNEKLRPNVFPPNGSPVAKDGTEDALCLACIMGAITALQASTTLSLLEIEDRIIAFLHILTILRKAQAEEDILDAATKLTQQLPGAES